MPIFILRSHAGQRRPNVSLRRAEMCNKGEYPTGGLVSPPSVLVRTTSSYTAALSTPCCQLPTPSAAYARSLQKKATPSESYLDSTCLSVPRSPINSDCPGISSKINQLKMQKAAFKIRRLCAFNFPRNDVNVLPPPKKTLMALTEIAAKNQEPLISKEEVRTIEGIPLHETINSDMSNVWLTASNEVLNVIVTESEHRCDIFEAESTARNKLLASESSEYLKVQNNAKNKKRATPREEQLPVTVSNETKMSPKVAVSSQKPRPLKAVRRPKPDKAGFKSPRQREKLQSPTNTNKLKMRQMHDELLAQLEVQFQHEYQLIDAEAKRERREIESQEVSNFIRKSRPAKKNYNTEKLRQKIQLLEEEESTSCTLPCVPHPPACDRNSFTRHPSLTLPPIH